MRLMRVLRIKTDLKGTELFKALDGLDAVAVKEGCVGSLEEIELANHLAVSAMDKKTNIARSLRYEFLLWLSGKTDIKSAFKETGPDSNEFIVVSFSDKQEEEVVGHLKGDPQDLRLKEKADPLALERISLSRVKN